MENKIETTFSEAERFSFWGAISVRASEAKMQGFLLGIQARVWGKPSSGEIIGK